MEGFQVFQKISVKDTQRCQIGNIFFCKMKVFNVVDDLLQTCGNGIAAVTGIAAVKCIENNSFVAVLVVKIALHHSKLIKVCEKR